jgi:O-antigen/teichoic acid export membrane protein
MKITNDIKYYGVAKLITIFSWLAILKLFTDNLSPQEYGNYSLTYTLIVLLSASASMWITTSIIRFYPDALERDKLKLFSYIGIQAVIPTFVVGILLLGLGFLILNVFEILQYNFLIYFLVLFCFFGHLSFLLYSSYLSGARSLGKYLILIALQISLYLGCSVYFINVLGMKLEGVFLGLVISYLPILFLAKISISHLLKVAKKIKLKRFQKYARYGFPIVFMSISIQLNSVADQYILKFYQFHIEVGMYAAFYVISEKSLFVAYQVLSISALPIVFRYWEKGDFVKSYKLLWQVIIVYTFLGLIGIGLLLCFDEELTSLIINERFMAGIYIMPYVLSGVFLGGFAALMSDVLLLKKKTLLLAKVYISGAFFNILLNFILIPIYGMLGAAIATFISYAFIFILMVYYLYVTTDMFKYMNIR